jgi:hypothetical protein
MFPNLSDMPSLGLAKQKIGSVWICVPDPKLFQDWINDGLANATYRFLCNQQSASACVDYDGESTEEQKCGFGGLISISIMVVLSEYSGFIASSTLP